MLLPRRGASIIADPSAECCFERAGREPREVAETIGTAMTSERPRARYLVGRDAKLRAPAAMILPDRVMDRLIARALGGGRKR